jgi:hypothetical protein
MRVSRSGAGDEHDLVSALSDAAALFFVMVVAHTALRDSIAAVKMTYLEYLYILLYTRWYTW